MGPWPIGGAVGAEGVVAGEAERALGKSGTDSALDAEASAALAPAAFLSSMSLAPSAMPSGERLQTQLVVEGLLALDEEALLRDGDAAARFELRHDFRHARFARHLQRVLHTGGSWPGETRNPKQHNVCFTPHGRARRETQSNTQKGQSAP